MDVRKKLFTIGMVWHQNRLPRKVVDANIPGDIQGQAGQGSEHPDLLVGIPGPELDQMTTRGVFKLKQFYGSVCFLIN